jgi:hypothetical protein
LKINEAFEGLLKNKDSVYQSKKGGYRSELSLCKSGFFYLKVYNKLGEEIDSSLGGGGFNGNIEAGNEWELVSQPVDFMTAVNSDKRISSEDGVIILCYPGALVRNGWLTISQINGKWLIE